MPTSIARFILVFACLASAACDSDSTSNRADFSESLNLSDELRSVTVTPSTLEEKIRVLADFGVAANTTSLGDPIRIDLTNPWHSPGNYLSLLSALASVHAKGGFVSLNPPYQMTIFGETYERVPTAIFRVDPKNFVRLVDCQGNGVPDLDFRLKDSSTTVVTQSSGHWYFVIPPTDETGFPNSEYLRISLHIPDGPLPPPRDVRLVGCDFIPVS